MLTGQLIAGRYRLEEEVGAGGMGVVWRAIDEKLDRTVALKRAHTSGPSRTLREARASAGLSNPHVITLHDVINDGGDQWLVLEYFPARSLAELISEPMDPERVAGIGAQLADALVAVHANSTVHRDVKPSNVLVTEDGVAKLIDFGISRTEWSEPTLTDPSFAGTPAYLAPEVASGEDPSPASDVFALGATLFAAVEGTSPYGDSDNALEILRKAARGQVIAAQHAGPLRPMLTAMLQKDPRRRPDAARVAHQLGELASGNETTPLRNKGIPRPRGRSVAVLGTAVAVVAAAAVVTLVVRGQHGDTSEIQPGAANQQASAGLGIGDPHTADPCAFADPTVFAKFGHATQQTDSGNFNRCDVILNENDANEADVRFEFESPGPDAPPGGPEHQVGALRVVQEPPESDAAGRFVTLPDKNRVEVTAQLGDEGSTGASGQLSAIADVAINHVVAVLNRGQIPRRTAAFPADSLANVDACSLLDPATLAAVPGLDVNNPDSRFGGWDCRWNSTVDNIGVQLRFDLNQPPLTAEDGTPTTMGMHKAFIEPKGDDDDSCVIEVVNRQFTDRTNQQTQELMALEVNGDQPVSKMCTTAGSLARSAAGKLPG